MPKAKTSKRRTRTSKLSGGKKELTKNQKKKVKGGLLPAFTTGIIPHNTALIRPTYTLGSPLLGAASQLLDSEVRINE